MLSGCCEMPAVKFHSVFHKGQADANLDFDASALGVLTFSSALVCPSSLRAMTTKALQNRTVEAEDIIYGRVRTAANARIFLTRMACMGEVHRGQR